jgi:tRNA threonylcarbamoyladenosine biosynthesis protein TsaE
MDSFSVISASPEQTDRIGTIVAEQLRPGDAVLLNGELAAGKTRFVKAVAAALGSTDLVTSPTFALAQFYTSPQAPILHVDTYRLSGPEEYRDLALEDYAASSISLVEWGDDIAEEFPAHLSIRFDPAAGGTDRRTLTFTSPSERWTARFAELQGAIQEGLA